MALYVRAGTIRREWPLSFGQLYKECIQSGFGGENGFAGTDMAQEYAANTLATPSPDGGRSESPAVGTGNYLCRLLKRQK
jgi:hypothetical protein